MSNVQKVANNASIPRLVHRSNQHRQLCIRVDSTQRFHKMKPKVTAAFVGFALLATGVGIGFAEIHDAANKTNAVAAAAHETAKHSALTRVSTVKQRCDLTDLILHGVAVKPHYRQKLEASSVKCREQLKEVEAIAKESK